MEVCVFSWLLTALSVGLYGKNTHAEDWCKHLVVSPSFLLVEYGRPAEVNCFINNTNQTLNKYKMGWESISSQPSTENQRSVMWKVESLTMWDEDLIICYLRVEETQCEKRVKVTIYKTPDSVTLSSGSALWVIGHQKQLMCQIKNVGPGSKLSVRWSRADPKQNKFTSFSETLFSDVVKKEGIVNMTANLNVTPSREDNGARYQCTAVLNLDKNQTLITSQPVTIVLPSGTQTHIIAPVIIIVLAAVSIWCTY